MNRVAGLIRCDGGPDGLLCRSRGSVALGHSGRRTIAVPRRLEELERLCKAIAGHADIAELGA